MYPTFYSLFYDWFGVDWPVLQLVYTYGFFVALAIFTAFTILRREVKRLGQAGILPSYPIDPTEQQAKATNPLIGYVLQGALGFVFGYKAFFALLNTDVVAANPRDYMLSAEGNILGGLILAALMVYLKVRENKKNAQIPTEPITEIRPEHHVFKLSIWAVIAGVVGSKLFTLLDDPSSFITFIKDPLNDFGAGQTIYGALIGGASAIIWYARKHKLPLLPLLDALSPSVILAYGVGRLGCQVSGDGDWGITNLATAPSWIPDWLWSYRYPNNIINEGIALSADKCINPDYCHILENPVYPTPLYETLLCIVIFAVLWFLCKRIKTAGILFALYLIFNGIERFSIERIRINIRYDWIGLTQAEIIAILLVLTGTILAFMLHRKKSLP